MTGTDADDDNTEEVRKHELATRIREALEG